VVQCQAAAAAAYVTNAQYFMLVTFISYHARVLAVRICWI